MTALVVYYLTYKNILTKNSSSGDSAVLIIPSRFLVSHTEFDSC